MEIDAEQLTIPDTDYKCTIKMPSEEFQRISRVPKKVSAFRFRETSGPEIS